MGQKVNPVGFRLGINRGWDSVWYAKKKDFGNYLIEDFKIRNYIKKNVVNSGVSKVMIERTSKKCFVTIYTSRPGFVIGKKGSDIEKIKNKLKNMNLFINCSYFEGFPNSVVESLSNGKQVTILATLEYRSGDFEIELILMDDYSTDSTSEVINSLLENHPKSSRVKYIRHEKNIGVIPNFIQALKKCNGKY